MGIALESTGAIELAGKHYADATRSAAFEPKLALQYVAFLQRRGGAAQVEEILKRGSKPLSAKC